MNIRFFKLFLLSIILNSCTSHSVKEKNDRLSKIESLFELEHYDSKRFVLDSVTAPMPRFTQFFIDSDKTRYFSLLNFYTNSIYIYDYTSTDFIKSISYNKIGPDAILTPTGYFIKNMDSLYIYNKVLAELVLANSSGRIIDRISLRGEVSSKNWYLYYPQYNPETVTPFFETNGELLFTGQYFGSIPNSIRRIFKFNAQIDLKTQKVEFSHIYPENLYGYNSNWEGGLFTEVFPALHPDGDKMIYSFPVSHHIYIADIKSNSYKKVYAGSKYAGTIVPMHINPKKTTNVESIYHWCKYDMYAAIIYDKYREVYYRFIRRRIDDVTMQNKLKDKNIAIIILDKDFKYLGETEIGTGHDWQWQNSFVTQEGLNIEYIEKDFDEVYLTFNIFKLKKI